MTLIVMHLSLFSVVVGTRRKWSDLWDIFHHQKWETVFQTLLCKFLQSEYTKYINNYNKKSHEMFSKVIPIFIQWVRNAPVFNLGEWFGPKRHNFIIENNKKCEQNVIAMIAVKPHADKNINHSSTVTTS